MTADRTQHVLDAIDGALDDWSVSGDAMRWMPEPAPTPRLPLVRFVFERETVPNFAEQMAAATAELLRAFGRIGEAIQPFASRIAVAHAAEMERRSQRAPASFAGLRPIAVIIDEPFDVDPRARALRLRRTRNTGPERAPAGRQKRPRDL